MTSLNSLNYSGNGAFDPNSNFYTWNKRSFPVFNTIPQGAHLQDYNYNPQIIDETYKELYQQKKSFGQGKDDLHNLQNMLNTDRGYSTNEMYYAMKDIQLDKVGFKFFTKENMRLLQKQIKDVIRRKTHGKVIMECDQDESDLLVAMRNIYVTEGRFLPDNIDFQVERLNMRLINKIVPDMITQIKQSWGYQKLINEPIHPIDRPISDCNRGRKLLPSVTTIWEVKK